MNEADHKDQGKIGLQYVYSMPGLELVAKVGDFGAQKYGQWNYKAGMPWMKLAGSIARHFFAWLSHEDLDKESGLPHLAHLVYDGLMLLDYSIRQKGVDDRYAEIPESGDPLSF